MKAQTLYASSPQKKWSEELVDKAAIKQKVRAEMQKILQSKTEQNSQRQRDIQAENSAELTQLKKVNRTLDES